VKRALLPLCCAALALLPSSARPGTRDVHTGLGLGFARAIPASRSASRDAPAFALAFAPRGIRTAATELALATLPARGVTIRPGFYGLIELEGDARDGAFRLWPSQEIALWRGAYGVQAAVALDALGARLCHGCTLEATGMFRHESEHHTAPNDGTSSTDHSGRPLVGDAVVVDLAGAFPAGRYLVAPRLAYQAFLPGRSSYRAGVALDVHARYTGWARAQPFVSGYAERRAGGAMDGRRYQDAYLLRALAGVAIPSSLGDLMLYGSADVGHRKGLAADTEEATVGLGVRLALGPVAPGR
jgi:hypothetical protein